MTLKEYLQMTDGENGPFLVNVRKDREKLYLGYSNEIPEETAIMQVKSVYIDWADECLGIKVE